VSEKKEICPVCGRIIDYYDRKIVRSRAGTRVYVYAVHASRDPLSGKRVRERCYLGPEDSYVYVSKTHLRDGLMFYGLVKRDRVIDYLRNILYSVRGMDLSETELREIRLLLREALREIEERLREASEKTQASLD
jgi:hypothetical protein